jgi:hypothetical protein
VKILTMRTRSVSGGKMSGGSPKMSKRGLENLDEAVALHRGEIGHEPTDVELEELGIDPEDNTTGEQHPPDVLE